MALTAHLTLCRRCPQQWRQRKAARLHTIEQRRGENRNPGKGELRRIRRIRNDDLSVAQNDVQATFAVDDQMLRTLATSLPQWLGMR